MIAIAVDQLRVLYPSVLEMSWMMRHCSDNFVKMATRDGYRARSAYKLIEIDNKHNILGHKRILDIGASPGSWSQVCVNRGGSVTAVDLLKMEPIKNCNFYRMDATSDNFLETIKDQRFDLILSDASPNLTGIKYADHQRSIDLIISFLKIIEKQLVIGGTFLTKVFMGDQLNQVYEMLEFGSVKSVKPVASRSESSEMYILAKGYKQIKN